MQIVARLLDNGFAVFLKTDQKLVTGIFFVINLILMLNFDYAVFVLKVYVSYFQDKIIKVKVFKLVLKIV